MADIRITLKLEGFDEIVLTPSNREEEQLLKGLQSKFDTSVLQDISQALSEAEQAIRSQYVQTVELDEF